MLTFIFFGIYASDASVLQFFMVMVSLPTTLTLFLKEIDTKMFPESITYGTSLMHSLDPRARIVAVLLFSGFVAILSRFQAIFLALACALFFMIIAKISFVKLAKRLILFNTFILFVWLLIFTMPGETLFEVGPFGVTDEGMQIATIITCKANAIFWAIVAFIGTMEVVTLGQAMQKLGFPDKLVHLLLFTFRYLYVLEKEFRKLYNAVVIRGFRPATNLHTYKTFAYLVGMLLVRSFGRAERIHEAMMCRGFHGKFYSLRQFAFSSCDYIMFPVVFLLITGIGCIEWRI